MLAEPHGARERKGVSHTRLFLVRGADPDIVAELACDAFQNLEARSVNAIIIGKEDTHQDTASSLSTPPI